MSKIKNSGFTGTILEADLASRKVEKTHLDREVVEKFLGGKGLGAYLLYRDLKPGTPPLSPKNKLLFLTGPLTGTAAPASVRFHIVTKSPATGCWLDSAAGGFWGPELKFAGYDGIIVSGRAEKPVYIWINDGEVEIRDASDLWGESNQATESVLKGRLGDKSIRVVTIGPAGERAIPLAGVYTEGRAAGRGGAGAVMGSKNLKAIAVRGHGKVQVCEPGKLRDIAREIVREIRAVGVVRDLKEAEKAVATVTMQDMIRMGTLGASNFFAAEAAIGARNYQQQVFEGAEEVSGESFSKFLWDDSRRTRPCRACAIACTHVARIEEGPWAGTEVKGPEYETTWALGPNCGISDRNAIVRANYLCDYYGLDTISLGNTIGFVMECFEKGLISEKDTDGIEMRFGNSDALVMAVEKAGKVEGKLGQLLAYGVKRASEKIGQGSEKFACHVKGLETPAWDLRRCWSQALGTAQADRGACHLRPATHGVDTASPEPFKPEGMAAMVKRSSEMTAAAWNSTGECLLAALALHPKYIQQMIVAATGLDIADVRALGKIGERITNLVRAFNVREGLSRKDDTLPSRFLDEPAVDGPAKGKVAPLDELLTQFYSLCGWDEDGKPTREKLQELGLDYVIKDLYA